MRTLVATKNMEKTEWLKWRTMGIGGSDASVIAGVNPYRSVFQLWKEKTGQVEPEEKDSEFTLRKPSGAGHQKGVYQKDRAESTEPLCDPAEREVSLYAGRFGRDHLRGP